MKVTRILATSLLFVATAFVATNAYADGAVRISWRSGASGCDYLQNLQFTGPGQLANLVASLVGESRTHRGYRLQISIGPNVPDSWRFDAAGCAVGNTALSTSGLSKSCPAFQGTNPLPISNYGYDGVSGKALVDVLNAYDSAAAANPVTRYTLFQYTFNHAFSDVGPQDPALACGFAERSLCLHLVYTEHLNPDLTSGTYNVENDFVTWQDPANDGGCPGATQNEESTWGRVKGLYR